MINDTIDILDAKVINIGINFSMKVSKDVDKYTIMEIALETLRGRYRLSGYIGEPFYISDIYTALNSIQGVVDVVKVQVLKRAGLNYSNHSFNINKNLSADGRFVVVPKNAVLEIKFPEDDIIGTII